MADVIENLEYDTTSELDAVEEQIQQEVEQATQTESPQSEDDDIPPQFRGKSLKEIAKYAASTEKALSKQGNELGEVRRLADELLRSQLMGAKAKEPEEAPKPDFFENPEEAVRSIVSSDPRVVAAEQFMRQQQRAQTQQALLQKHPDVGSIVTDAGFKEWVGASKVRTQLFQAAEAFDLDAADELLSTYKELKAVKQQKTQEVNKEVRDQTLRAASVDTGGTGESTKKVYRRADLIRLKINDPNRYEAMSDEILAAYREGRVK